jgi:hypothetical protein
MNAASGLSALWLKICRQSGKEADVDDKASQRQSCRKRE